MENTALPHRMNSTSARFVGCLGLARGAAVWSVIFLIAPQSLHDRAPEQDSRKTPGRRTDQRAPGAEQRREEAREREGIEFSWLLVDEFKLL